MGSEPPFDCLSATAPGVGNRGPLIRFTVSLTLRASTAVASSDVMPLEQTALVMSIPWS